jgi:steroid delta-isomerase
VSTPDLRLKALAQGYIDALNGRSADRVVALFREDATIEDPVGTPPWRGRAEIEAFYGSALDQVLRVEVQTAPRGSYGEAAAYAFRVHLSNRTLDVIGVLTFDEAGLIRSMRAYHGPSDLVEIEPLR